MNIVPKRIQRQRTKSWRKPEGAVYVGRGSKWGNPYTIQRSKDGLGDGMAKVFVPEESKTHYFFSDPISNEEPAHVQAAKFAVDKFREVWIPLADVGALRTNLAGKDLMCWCPLDQPCHADVLLELANGENHG